MIGQNLLAEMCVQKIYVCVNLENLLTEISNKNVLTEKIKDQVASIHNYYDKSLPKKPLEFIFSFQKQSFLPIRKEVTYDLRGKYLLHLPKARTVLTA